MSSDAQTIYESEIRKLPPGEQLRLVELITRDLATAAGADRDLRSIMELRGLGDEIWKDVDAQQYVKELRDEWGYRP